MQDCFALFLPGFKHCGVHFMEVLINCTGNVREINNNGDTDAYLAKQKIKNDPFRLMGLDMGFYKTLIHVLKLLESCEVLETLGSPILKLLKDEAALN
jgi:hypothetical protein